MTEAGMSKSTAERLGAREIVKSALFNMLTRCSLAEKETRYLPEVVCIWDKFE